MVGVPGMAGAYGGNDPLSGGMDFRGDLVPGGGGSMLFGPGNPQFDSRFRPGGLGSGGVGGGAPGSGPNVPGARFDPYGPPVSGYPGAGRGSNPRRSHYGGEPDPDDFPPPGNMYM